MAAAASQWGIGFVLNRYRASKRTKYERVLVLHLGAWRWEWQWKPQPFQRDMFNDNAPTPTMQRVDHE